MLNELISTSALEATFGEHVRCVERDGNIALYSATTPGTKYSTVSPISSVALTEPRTSAELADVRGLIYLNDQLHVKTYPFTLTWNTSAETPQEVMGSIMNLPIRDCKIFEAHEGNLIRVFFAESRWYISTHRKLDAFKSRWGSSTSYGEQFCVTLESMQSQYPHLQNAFEQVTPQENLAEPFPEAYRPILSRYLSALDPQKCYTYLVLNTPENRIVCHAPALPMMYYTGSFPVGQIGNPCLTDEPFGITASRECRMTSWERLYHFVQEEVDYMTNQGVIIFLPNGQQIKLWNSDYHYLCETRGNEKSIKFRYLQVRMDLERLNGLVFLYPEMHAAFDAYENTLYEIARNLRSLYIRRYAYKESITLPLTEHKLLRAYHDWHCQNRVENRISMDIIFQHLNALSAPILNHLIADWNDPEKRKAAQGQLELPEVVKARALNANRRREKSGAASGADATYTTVKIRKYRLGTSVSPNPSPETDIAPSINAFSALESILE